jgi:alkanesulfonate monooxygenase SsuD/methylene tetrahydromethanopterin reductase-like flavin-dependent oxidoreductase (luciferase family)
MQFGVMVIGPYQSEIDPSQMYQQSLVQARTAVANNFDALFTAQHYLSGPAAAMMQPLILLSNLAAEARGLYLGTALFLLPLHHPVAVAEQTASLDIISGGKFLFGVGQGYRDVEFESFGLRKKDRRRRMAESMELIRRLWSEDNVTFEGRFFKLNGVTIAPKPLQKPGPPVFVGADILQTVARVPEVGDHWIASRRHTKSFLREAVPIYQRALGEHGKDFKGLFMFRDLCVAESTAEAEKRIKEAYERMYQVYHKWGQPGERYDVGFDELKHERLIVGSPEEVAHQVLAYHREFGVQFMSFTVHWPGMDHRWTLETIRLFGEKVIPEVNRLAPEGLLP